MKKSLSAFFVLTLILISYTQINSNPTGAPSGVAGGPAESGSTCYQSGCHTGSPTLVSNILTSTVPAAGYTGGQAYTFTITVTGSGNKGFEVSPQSTSGIYLGKLATGSGTQIIGTKYITHTIYKSSTTATWTFQWTAPPVGTGDVNFYGAFAITRGTTRKQILPVPEAFSVDSTPVVKTAAASNIGPVSARINGSINPRGKTVNASFHYKPAGGAWTFVNCTPSTVNGSTLASITQIISGLQPNTTYTFQSCGWKTGDSTWGDPLTFTTLAQTGIDELNNMSAFKLFPNPAHDQLQISFQLKKPAAIAIHALGMDGKSVELKGITMISGNQDMMLPLDQLKPGIYILQISSHDETHYEKILVQ